MPRAAPGRPDVCAHGPERRQVEVAQVLLLALLRPRGVGVGQVVEGPHCPGLERARTPQAGERPPVEGRGPRHEQRLVLGANTFREFAELLGPIDEAELDAVNLRMKRMPTTVVSTFLVVRLRSLVLRAPSSFSIRRDRAG